MSPDAVLHAGAPPEDPAEGGLEGPAEGGLESPAEGRLEAPAEGGAGEEPTAAPAWTLADRGSFVVGTCDACGYTSPARRARFSAESDMLAHEILCQA